MAATAVALGLAIRGAVAVPAGAVTTQTDIGRDVPYAASPHPEQHLDFYWPAATPDYRLASSFQWPAMPLDVDPTLAAVLAFVGATGTGGS